MHPDAGEVVLEVRNMVKSIFGLVLWELYTLYGVEGGGHADRQRANGLISLEELPFGCDFLAPEASRVAME